MVQTGKQVTYIDFSDRDGLTTEAPPPRLPTRAPSQQFRPPEVTQREHPLETIARQKYEQRVRQAFAHGRAVPGFKPPTTTFWGAVGDAIDMGAQWLFEYGSDRQIYRDATPQVQEMRFAHRVFEAREFFYRKNASAVDNGEPLMAVLGYSGSFYPIGPLRAGANPIQQFVGSYNIDIYPNADNTITFVLTNVTSVKSGTYHAGPEYPRGKVGFGGNQTQLYIWTEPRRLRTYR